MTITSSLRFLYIFGGSGLLCAGASGRLVGGCALRDQDSCIQIALDSWPLLPIVVCFFFSLVHVQCSLSFPSSLELSLWKKAREKAMAYEGSSVVEFFFCWSNHIFLIWFFMKGMVFKIWEELNFITIHQYIQWSDTQNKLKKSIRARWN